MRTKLNYKQPITIFSLIAIILSFQACENFLINGEGASEESQKTPISDVLDENTGHEFTEKEPQESQQESTDHFALKFEEELDPHHFYIQIHPEDYISMYSLEPVPYVQGSQYKIWIHYPSLRSIPSSEEVGYAYYGFYMHEFQIEEIPLYWDTDQVYYLKDLETPVLTLEEAQNDSIYSTYFYQATQPKLERVSTSKDHQNMKLLCPSNQNFKQEKIQLGVIVEGEFIPQCEYSESTFDPVQFESKPEYSKYPTGMREYFNGKWHDMF